MAKCPSCGKEVEEPLKVLSNDSFAVEEYRCANCYHEFKVVS